MTTTTTATTTGAGLSIGEVSRRTGLSAHTLRFYENEGLLGRGVGRDAAGRRVFSEVDVEWLTVCTKLRATGMPLPAIRHYVELYDAGPDTVGERFALLRDHENDVRRKLAELQEALDVIEHKVAFYASRLDAGTAHEVWSHGPECEPVAE